MQTQPDFEQSEGGHSDDVKTKPLEKVDLGQLSVVAKSTETVLVTPQTAPAHQSSKVVMPGTASNVSISSKDAMVLQPNQSAETFIKLRMNNFSEKPIFTKSITGNEDYPLGDSREKASSEERTIVNPNHRSTSGFSNHETLKTSKASEKNLYFRNQNAALSYETIPLVINSAIRDSAATQQALPVVCQSVKNLDKKRVASQQELDTDEMSCSVRETEEAPSNHGYLAIEQQGVVMVTISDVEGEDDDQLAKEESLCQSMKQMSQKDSTNQVTQSQEQIGNQEHLAGKAARESAPIMAKVSYTDSELTEKSGRISSDKALKKPSDDPLSSNESHQQTRSAVDKGNLVQQCTEPSEEKPNQSQQSSQVSQYFQQIVSEEDQQVNSGEMLMENEDFCLGGINSDLMHLVPNSATASAAPYPPSQVFASSELQEQSKESSSQGGDLYRPSLAQNNNQSSIEDIHQHKSSIEKHQSPKQQLLNASNTPNSSLPNIHDQTPQFHGSSPVILEQPTEEDTTIELTTQPNYESDGGVALRCQATPAVDETTPMSRNRISHTQTPQEETKKSHENHGSSLVVVDEQSKNDTSSRGWHQNNDYILQKSLRILPGSEGYDPGVCSESDYRTATISQDNNRIQSSIPSQAIKIEEPNLGTQQQQQQQLFTSQANELKISDTLNTNNDRSAKSLGMSPDNRYKIQNALVDDYTNNNMSRDATTKLDGIRGSSRFSKGHQVELDRVAERINNPLLLNSGSTGDMLHQSRQQEPKEEPSSHQSAQKLNQRQSVGEKSQESELPPGATQQFKVEPTVAAEAQTAAIYCREMKSPVSDNLPTQRRRSRMGQPCIPNNVESAEEARQRYSTPRHGSNKSPISSKSGARKSKSPKSTYPISVGKKLITGPVLRSNAQNANVAISSSNKYKVKRRKNTVDHTVESGETTQRGGYLTSKPMTMQQTSRPVKERKSSQNQSNPRADANHKRNNTVSQDDSQRLENTSILLLPKRKIKPKRQLNIANQESSLSRERSKGSKMTRKPAVPRVNMLKRRKESKRKSIGGDRVTVASVFKRNDLPSIEATVQNLPRESDLLSNSAFREDVQFDKKQSPRYPQPVTLDNSSIDFLESTTNKTFAGISQQAITQMPIDQIYAVMSKNWTKDKVMFERKCQKAVQDTIDHQESQIQQPSEMTELAKHRQQRFDILKQRLLQNSGLRTTKRSSSRPSQQQTNIDSDYAKIQDKLKDLESVFSAKQTQQMYSTAPGQRNQQLQQQQKAKPVQFGQFQFIFNKPEELFLPPSPNECLKFKLQNHSHQSQGQFMRHVPNNLTNNAGGERLKSQVLTPLVPSPLNSSSIQQPVIAINTSPHNFSSFIKNKTTGAPTPAQIFSGKPKSSSSNVYAERSKQPYSGNITVVNFNSNGNKKLDAIKPPAHGMPRATTANNYSRHRKVGLMDALNNNGVQIQSSDHVGQNVMKRKATTSPSVHTTNQDQQRLLQKLQYRSMRGRRIKEYLDQVKSQRIAPSKPQMQVQTNIDEDSAYGQNNMLKMQSHISDSTVQRAPASSKSNSFFLPPDDYGVTQINNNMPGLLTDAEVLAASENGSLNQLESKNDNSWLLSNQGENVNTFDESRKVMYDSSGFQKGWMQGGGADDHRAVAQSPNTQSAVLNNFLQQQDKRVDFGMCQLFQKVRDDARLDFNGDSMDQKLLTITDLENLISLIKRKNHQAMTKHFLLKTHEECFNTINVMLTELGMGYRAARMQRDEAQINVERVYVLVCRAHKLHRARIDLMSIFDLIVQFEEKLPKIKHLVIRNLSGTGSKVGSRMMSSEATGSNQSAALDAAAKSDLEKLSMELKCILSKLILQIPNLLECFKFFNNSFVFNDKDYLKYLSKEANEVKGLLNVFNIHF